MHKSATLGKQRRVSNEKIRKRVLLYDHKLYSGQFTPGKPKKKKKYCVLIFSFKKRHNAVVKKRTRFKNVEEQNERRNDVL